MLVLTMTVTGGEEVVSELREIAAGIENPAAMHAAASTAVEREMKAHLKAHYVTQHPGGEGFWERAANSIEVESGADGASVSLVETGVALRYYGGEVLPGKSISSFTGELTRALAVPTNAVPYSRGHRLRPGDSKIGPLAFIRAIARGETVGWLVQGMERTVKRGKNKGRKRTVPKPGGSLLFTLRTITRHTGDKGILPSDQRLSEAVGEAIVDVLGE